jgi:hypothetical protein
MSRRLLQLVIPVTPDRRMFRIHDPAVDPDGPGGPLPPVGTLISTNREQLWVGSLQEDIDVRLVLEEWDAAPPPCGDVWDEEAKSTVYLRGQVSISMGLAGTAVRGLRLAGGVGDYSVRVYAGNRDIVTRRYAELFDRHRNPLSDEFQQEKRKLEGLERYLVQLWRESLSAAGNGPDADDVEPPAALVSLPCAVLVAAADEAPGLDALVPVAAIDCAGVPCGWPPAAAGVVIAEVPVVFATAGRCPWPRNGIIAYTISETSPTSRTVNREPMMRARGERSTVAGPGRLNAVRQVASPGSSAASRRSISASTRCSSIDSAIPPPPPRALGAYPLTISQQTVFIQLFLLCTSVVFHPRRCTWAATSDREPDRC